MSELRTFNPSLAGKESSLHLRRMEDLYAEAKGQVDAPHRHDYYTVIWTQRGEGSHIIDFNTYPLTPNSVFFVSPGQIHQVITPTEPQGWVITFSKAFLQHHHISEDFIARINLFNSFEEQPPIRLPEATAQKMQAIFEMMAADYTTPGDHQIALLSAYLKIFLIHCVNVCDLGAQDWPQKQGGKAVLQTFKNLVSRHFRELHKVGDYAAKMSITPKYLNQVVKSLLGLTAKEVIQEKIILNAKRELKYSDKSVKEIAYELGFEEPLYFSQFFKKCTGKSPSTFRES